MSNLNKRIIASIILLALCWSTLVYSNITRWSLIITIFSLGAYEFFNLISVKFKSHWLWKWGFSALSMLLFLQPLANGNLPSVPLGVRILAVCILAVFLIIAGGFAFLPLQDVTPWIFFNICGFLFFGLWVGQIHQIPGLQSQAGFAGISHLVLLVTCVVFADSFGYIVGRAFGKHKLCPHISPGKSIEGAIGGVLSATIAVAFLTPLLTSLTTIQGFIFGIIISISSIYGDLLISVIKRYVQVKDTSNLIPGHGGVLDRFDALFFSIPIGALTFKVFGL